MSLSGEPLECDLDALTLVLAVKEECMGCRNVIEAPANSFGEVAVLIVASAMPSEPWWSTSPHRVVISAPLLMALDVRWPPFYVLVDPVVGRVVTEGVIFGSEQVREEIAPYLV